MYARTSDYALGLIILTEETESNLKVVREIARKSLLMSWHSKLVHSRRRRIFTREIWGRNTYGRNGVSCVSKA